MADKRSTSTSSSNTKRHTCSTALPQCLDPLTPEEREEFFDEVAILESTKLDAILKGEA
ncbi:MAG: hypothetical protein ACKVQW_04595 [Pyrinomonadaceae bacterium]